MKGAVNIENAWGEPGVFLFERFAFDSRLSENNDEKGCENSQNTYLDRKQKKLAIRKGLPSFSCYVPGIISPILWILFPILEA